MIAPSPEELTRIQRATEQAADYLVLPSLDDPDAFDVVGKRGQTYHVTPEGCGCQDSQQRGLRCKHYWRVRAHVASLIAAADLKARRERVARNMARDFPAEDN
jgi:hypothetical protein